MRFDPCWIIGKTVASVEMRPFDDGRKKLGGVQKRTTYGHDPLITFTDGSAITFATEETEIGQYGTMICYSNATK